MKIFNFLKNRNNTQNVQVSAHPAFPEEDINLLAMMCEICCPNIYKSGLVYAYYLPVGDEELLLAKNIFEKNGISMHVHSSNITGFDERNVLRVCYDSSKNKDYIFKTMDKINQKHFNLFFIENLAERKILLQKIAQLKQKEQ